MRLALKDEGKGFTVRSATPAMLNDYRQVLGGLFQRVYGLDDRRLQKVFPGAKPRNLRLV